MTMNTKPVELSLSGSAFELRSLKAGDEPQLADFFKRLPKHDLLYVPRDVSNPKILEAWFRTTSEDDMRTIIATDGERIVGSAALIVDPLSWSPHVGEIRVMIDASSRRLGLGRALIENRYNEAVEMGLEKLIARMTIDQRGAFAIFEPMGFVGEALLKRHVRDEDGNAHDIALLSCHLTK